MEEVDGPAAFAMILWRSAVIISLKTLIASLTRKTLGLGAGGGGRGCGARGGGFGRGIGFQRGGA